jgi:hypothetical protein
MALYSCAVNSFKVQMLFASAMDDRPRREWRDGNDGPAGRVRGRGMLADVAAAHGIITRPCRRAGASVFSAGVFVISRAPPLLLPSPRASSLRQRSASGCAVYLSPAPRIRAFQPDITSHHRVTTSTRPACARLRKRCSPVSRMFLPH